MTLPQLLRSPEGEFGGGAPASSSPAETVTQSPITVEGPAATPPSTSKSVSTQIGDMPADIKALFDGDPVPEPQSAVPAEPSAAPASGEPIPEQETVAPLAPVEQQLDPVALQSRIDTLTDLVARSMQAQQAPAPAPADVAPEVSLPGHGYQMTIPDGLDTALISDNPVERKQALQALVMGTARTVHTEVVKAMRAEFASVLPRVVQNNLAQSQQQQSVFNDFYGTYPEFSAPQFRPLVQQVARQVANEMRANTWSPDLRDALGNRLRQLLASASARPAPSQAPQAPAVLSSSSRPAQPGPDSSAPFRDLLF